MKAKLSFIFAFIYFVCLFMPCPAYTQSIILNKRSGDAQLADQDVTKSFSDISDTQALSKPPEIGGIPVTGPGTGVSLSYHIHVLGEVGRPGAYQILPSDRVSSAIQFAGGILRSGSERRVQLRRSESTKHLDLYSYKHDGRLSQNPYLMENDVIFVPLKKGEIEIEGPVNRSGFYEIFKPVSLEQAVKMAGGFAAGHSRKQPIRIIRYDKNEEKRIIEVEFSKKAFEENMVEAGDVIVVPHVLLLNKKFDYNIKRIPGDNLFYPTLNNNVYVVGAVSMPGPYEFQPSYSVQDYVSQAGPSNDASLKRPKIINAEGKRMIAKKNSQVNPGDTIIVPSKSITAGNFISWFGTLTNMALTTFIFVDRFAN